MKKETKQESLILLHKIYVSEHWTYSKAAEHLHHYDKSMKNLNLNNIDIYNIILPTTDITQQDIKVVFSTFNINMETNMSIDEILNEINKTIKEYEKDK